MPVNILDVYSNFTKLNRSMIEVLRIDHIVLRTNKLKEMLAFYCNVLGCEVERETSDTFGLTQLRAGDALIDLVTVEGELGKQGDGPPSQTDNNVDHFCLQLKKISEQELTAHLKSHNILTGEFANRYGAQGMGRSIYLQDPEGNTVELRSQL